MIDPFTLATGIAGLASLTIEVVKVCHEYASDARSAPLAVKALIKELMGFKKVLSDLEDNVILNEDLVESLEGRCLSVMSSLSIEIDHEVETSASFNMLEQCTTDLNDLLTTLKKYVSGSRLEKGVRRLQWPFEKDATQSKITAIQWYRDIFTTSLSIDNLVLSAKILQQAKMANKQQSDWLNRERTKGVLEWLSPLEFGEKHRDTHSKLTQGTGEWILDRTEFSAWKGRLSKSILWCPGEPGVGKTVISSLIIEHLKRATDTKTTALAYIYCDYKDKHRQTPVNLIGALNKQLTRQCQSLPPQLTELYKSAETQSAKPTLKEQTELLVSLCTHFRTTFIVIDALDEVDSSNPQNRSTLIDALLELSSKGIAILVTSRPNPRDIVTKFEAMSTLKIMAANDDIKSFLEQDIQRYESLAEILEDEAFREQVVSRIVKDANGLFLLASLHLKRINDHTCRAEILESLDDMTGSLVETYEETLERIEQQTRNRRQLAIEVLIWISFARQPLQVDELQHAIAVRPGMKSFNSDQIRAPKTLIDVCAGLVTVEKGTKIVKLSHYTVQEFLQSRSNHFQDANLVIARTCLQYLQLDEFKRPEGENEERGDKIPWLSRYQYIDELDMPLKSYAGRNWGFHAVGSPETVLQESIINYLTSPVCPAIQASFCEGYRAPAYPPIFWASYFGLTQIVKCLLDKTGLLDIRDGVIQQILEMKKKDIVRPILLGMFKDWEPGSRMTNILPNAAAAEDYEMMRKVFERDVNVNSKDKQGRTALHYCAKNGNSEEAIFLLRRNASPTAVDLEGNTPLLFATTLKVLTVLVNHGARVEHKNHKNRTALQDFIARGDTQAVKFLFDHGADSSVHYWTPLIDSGERETMMLFLVERATNVDVADEEGMTYLHRSAEYNLIKVIKLLLERGANLESRCKLGRTPLLQARFEDSMILLIERGANVNAAHKFGGTALHEALRRRWFKATKLLLERGASPQARDSRGFAARDFVKPLLNTPSVDDKREHADLIEMLSISEDETYFQHDSNEDLFSISEDETDSQDDLNEDFGDGISKKGKKKKKELGARADHTPAWKLPP